MRSKPLTFAFIAIAVVAVAFVSCSEDRVTSDYDSHPTGWMDPYSSEWHGQAAISSSGESCLGCHALSGSAQGFDNGPEQEETVPTVGTACYDCHAYPHVEGFGESHPQRFTNTENWAAISSCQSCHGVDFTGGRTGASCNECHTQQGGPAACNTCHGMPPTTTRPLGSENPGAHSAHARYACTECHHRVAGLDHIDTLPADIGYADARIATANGYPVSYDNSNCATWCHSNLHQGAPMVSVQWKTGQTLNACRSCHQVPPQSPFHPTDNQCHHCHPNVDPSSNYNDANFIRFVPGDTLHVNGTVNAIFP
ncbi:MAG: hypothetical protein IPH10_05775 [bacterium]|nr:hypothetical protein [bacterium]